MRVGLDLSITAFNAAGNARYAVGLLQALRDAGEVELVPLAPPSALRATGGGAARKALVAFWEFVYAPVLLPLLARRHRLDLLHCPLPMPVGDPGCPLVVTVLDAIPALYPQWFSRVMGLRLRRWLRRGVAAADALLTISQHTADDVRRLFPGLATPIYPVYLGSFLDPAPAQGAVSASPYILSVGTLEPRKNLARTLEAYAQLVRMRPAAPRLVVVGGQGWGGEDVAATATRLGIGGRVELAGFVDDRRLRELYAGAAMLVYPSLYEGFGFPVLEAMSLGCPVITSTTSSLPEVAGEAGLLVDPGDAGQIAAAMGRLLDEPGLAAHLRAEGARRARAFSWGRCARETAAVYRATRGAAGCRGRT